MISIVIPAYNAAATVGRCLDSLLAQTYRDFELIVVDDGSTDSTAQIISAYAERDSRIRLIRQENAGVSAARNVGLDARAATSSALPTATMPYRRNFLKHCCHCMRPASCRLPI